MIHSNVTILPIIKRRSSSKKNILSISKIEKSKSKVKECQSQRWKRKLSLNCKDNFNIQKRSLSHKRFSLKKIPTETNFKTLKLSERNTDDNSEPEKNNETFEQLKESKQTTESLTERAVDILKNMKQVDKIAKLYKKNHVKGKNLQNGQQNKTRLKNKYKCLVNANIFVSKSKHNNSDGAKSLKKNDKSHQEVTDQYWDKINESLILQSFRYQEPSKQLVDLVEHILTES